MVDDRAAARLAGWQAALLDDGEYLEDLVVAKAHTTTLLEVNTPAQDGATTRLHRQRIHAKV